MTGQQVLKQIINFNNQVVELDISNLSSGPYIMNVIEENGQKHQAKLIKQ